MLSRRSLLLFYTILGSSLSIRLRRAFIIMISLGDTNSLSAGRLILLCPMNCYHLELLLDYHFPHMYRYLQSFVLLLEGLFTGPTPLLRLFSAH